LDPNLFAGKVISYFHVKTSTPELTQNCVIVKGVHAWRQKGCLSWSADPGLHH